MYIALKFVSWNQRQYETKIHASIDKSGFYCVIEYHYKTIIIAIQGHYDFHLQF